MDVSRVVAALVGAGFQLESVCNGAGSLEDVFHSLMGLVAVNLANRGGGLVLYPLSVVVTMCVLGLFGAVFVAAVGVMISLRAATVRQAQQTLSAAIVVMLILPMAVAHLMPAALEARACDKRGGRGSTCDRGHGGIRGA